MSRARTGAELRELARLRGVQLSYTAQNGERVRANAGSLAAVLDALGHPVPNAAAVSEELERARDEQHREVIAAVVVREPCGTLSAPIRLPRQADPERCQVTVRREDGEVDRAAVADLTTPASDGNCSLDLSAMSLPAGYHQLAVEGPGVDALALLLVPPGRLRTESGVGLMAPLYALRGADDWGIGSYRDLAGFADLAGAWGARLAGTLPLFATSLRAPIDPSPYVPISRMFWNELYVDVAAAAELVGSPDARDLAAATGRAELADLRRRTDVDYDTVARLKRQALETFADQLAAGAGARRDRFEAFVAGHPELASYADFRAADERVPAGWRQWPTQPGELPEGGDPAAVRYHRFAQYAAMTQLAEVSDNGGPGRAGLYLDLPVGVHPDGYDTWSRPGLFAAAEVGAPPDKFFAGGQQWGFPPLHPERIRHDGYRYLVDSLRRVFRYARAVRIDHVLGLARQFWVPRGGDAQTGAYVRYHHEELRAVIAIEAHRAGVTVVGEDLGTVPAGIRGAMDRDGMLHTFVYQFEATPAHPLPQPRRPSAASLGSHDLPRFATFWRESAPPELVEAVGSDDPATALRTCLTSLAGGPATYVMVDLADLDGETEPDNRPGTGPEAGNWRHRLGRTLGELAEDPEIGALMTGIAETRVRTADAREEVTK
jgi:4-alpha-glucanotransferase